MVFPRVWGRASTPPGQEEEMLRRNLWESPNPGITRLTPNLICSDAPSSIQRAKMNLNLKSNLKLLA